MGLFVQTLDSNINCGVYYCGTAIAEFGGIGDEFEEEKSNAERGAAEVSHARNKRKGILIG